MPIQSESRYILDMHDFVAITTAILDDYALPWRGTHGVLHWARVWANGLRVAEGSGADVEIVKLFGGKKRYLKAITELEQELYKAA